MAAREKTAAFLKEKEQKGNPREQDAIDYMRRHKIMELLDNFTAQLLFSRPSDPRAFLMEKLQLLIKSRAVNLDPPVHFDKSNIEAVFGLMDPTKKGMISLEQYKAGMTTLGIKDFTLTPPGCDIDRISADTFGREARKGVIEQAMTYQPRQDHRDSLS